MLASYSRQPQPRIDYFEHTNDSILSPGEEAKIVKIGAGGFRLSDCRSEPEVGFFLLLDLAALFEYSEQLVGSYELACALRQLRRACMFEIRVVI